MIPSKTNKLTRVVRINSKSSAVFFMEKRINITFTVQATLR